MFSNILNAIPGVGHAKGALHYACGDFRGGNKAMYEATRSTAVIAGGAVGAVGGPAGMVLGATGAGMLTDSVTSIVTNKPQGTIAGVNNIVTELADGKVPVGSVLETGLLIGSDALCGFGGSVAGNVAGALSKSTGKSVGTEVVKAVAKSQSKAIFSAGVYVQAEFASRLRERSSLRYYRTYTSGSGSSSAASGAGSEPPRDNRGNGKKDHEKEEPEKEEPKPELGPEDFWLLFLRIFEAKSLDDIRIGTRYPFKGLTKGQKNTLKKLIKMLRAAGYVEQTVRIVLVILDNILIEDAVTFENFLSLAQFVASYFGEQLAQRIEVDRYSGSPIDSYNERRLRIAYAIILGADMETLLMDILHTFEDLWEEIYPFRTYCEPNFRNTFSALYHYYKHRLIPEKGIVLSVKEYFHLINSLLEKLKTLDVFKMLGPKKYETVFERYYKIFGRRVKIVVKYQDGKVVASCYPVSDRNYNDKDGDEYSDSVKLD